MSARTSDAAAISTAMCRHGSVKANRITGEAVGAADYVKGFGESFAEFGEKFAKFGEKFGKSFSDSMNAAMRGHGFDNAEIKVDLDEEIDRSIDQTIEDPLNHHFGDRSRFTADSFVGNVSMGKDGRFEADCITAENIGMGERAKLSAESVQAEQIALGDNAQVEVESISGSVCMQSGRIEAETIEGDVTVGGEGHLEVETIEGSVSMQSGSVGAESIDSIAMVNGTITAESIDTIVVAAGGTVYVTCEDQPQVEYRNIKE